MPAQTAPLEVRPVEPGAYERAGDGSRHPGVSVRRAGVSLRPVLAHYPRRAYLVAASGRAIAMGCPAPVGGAGAAIFLLRHRLLAERLGRHGLTLAAAGILLVLAAWIEYQTRRELGLRRPAPA